MKRNELAQLLPVKKIDRAITRAKERGILKGRVSDFPEDVAMEIVEYEWRRHNELLDNGMRPDGSFEHANRGIVRTQEQKNKYHESSLGNKNAIGKHDISEETRKKWSEIRKGKKPWNYDSELHAIIDKSGYCAQTVRKHGWGLEDCKQKSFGVSIGEDEMYAYVSSIAQDAIQHSRKIIGPKELDIYVPSKQVAIEYNGLYWHCNKDKNYHVDKMNACLEKGIRLIQIYEDEWYEKQEICKSIIASALGEYKERIPARKCEVKEVGKKEAKEFFKANHLKGNGSSNYCIGLYFEGSLVMAASFRKDFANKSKKVELSRMATKLHTQVLGGFSKLMKHCPYDNVVSFVDLRLYDGKGYESTGWNELYATEPGYCYTDFKNRHGRLSFCKKKCLSKWDDCDKSKTEQELCQEHGLYRIYDCGNLKLEWMR